MESIKSLIIKFCESQGGWLWGGKIDDYIRELIGSKASNVSRRCRELVEAGVLEVRYEQVEGKGPRCARYRLTIKDQKRYDGIVDSVVKSYENKERDEQCAQVPLFDEY